MPPFWKSRNQKTNLNGDPVEGRCFPDEHEVELSYLSLEPRRVLSADFSLLGGVLELDSFTEVVDENLVIQESITHHEFVLTEGTWTGVDSAQAVGNGTNVLTVDRNVITDLQVDANVAVDVVLRDSDFTQLNAISISTTGNILQSPGSTILATDMELNGRLVLLEGAANDFDRISGSSLLRSSFVDVDDLELGDFNIDTKLQVEANSISISGIVDSTNTTLNSQLGIVETTTGSVVSTNLILTGQGQFEFDSSQNNVQNLAAEVDGSLSFSNIDEIQIASLDCRGQTVCGITVSDDLSLTSQMGGIGQTSDATILVGGTTTLDAANGDICLLGGDCDGDGENDNDFNRVEVLAAANVEIADINELSIGTFQVQGNAALLAGPTAGDSIILDGSVVVGDKLLLRATNGVSQLSGSVTANGLLLEGNGDFRLGNISNSISKIAGSVQGTIEIGNAIDLEVSRLDMEFNCSPEQVSLNGINANDLIVTIANGDLNQTSSIVVSGTSEFDVGNGNICLAMGDFDGDGQNDNDFGRIEIISANEVELVDVNDLTLGAVEASGNVAVTAGDSIPGQIELDGNQNSGAQLLLKASNGLVQTSGFINSEQLLIDGTGDFHFCLANQIGGNSVGQISADVAGSLYLQNSNVTELTSLEFVSKSGATVSHNQFNVDGNLTVSSSADNASALFDSAQVVVSGMSAFVTSGTSSNIALDSLDVAGSIGLMTTDGNVQIINNHVNGIVFRGDDIPGTDANEICPHFENSTIVGDLIAQATDGDISNEAKATLKVSGNTNLIAGTQSSNSVSGYNNEFNIKIGLQPNDQIEFDSLSVNAAQVSMELDDSVLLTNTFVGTPDANQVTGGTLFLTIKGDLVQADSGIVQSENVAIRASNSIYFNDLDASRIALDARGFVDASTLNNTLVDLPVDPDDPFAPRHIDVDGHYGIVVSSSNNLVVGTVHDALNCQTQVDGIFADDGHAFIQTLDGGNIEFDGTGSSNIVFINNTNFEVASFMRNDHVLTAIADGDMTIAEGTMLLSDGGSVTQIDSFNTDEGRDFQNVSKEGPRAELFLPTPSDIPTTRTINNDNTQFVGVNLARIGDRRLIIEVDWADGTEDVFDFPAQSGERFTRVSHTFTDQFLFENFELPTTLRFFNEPTINLYDGGSVALSEVTDLNTNSNFLVAFSDSRPQGNLEIASVERPASPNRESVVFQNSDQVESETDANEFGPTETKTEEDESEAYLVRLDESGNEIEDSLDNLEDPTVTEDVIAKLKKQVEEGTQYPPGQYRIKWTESGVSFSIDFEKGAEEDLNPDEIQSLESDPASGTDDVLSPVIPDAPVEDEGPVLQFNSPENVSIVQPHNSTEDDVDIRYRVEEIEKPSKAGLIVAGAMSIGLARKNSKQDHHGKDPKSALANVEEDISFTKASRRRRKLNGDSK